MTNYFTKRIDSIACNIPKRSANGNRQINTTNSVDNKIPNVLESVWQLYSNLSARHIKSAGCKSAVPLNFCTDVFRDKKELKRVSSEQQTIHFSEDKTDHVEYKNKNIVTDNPEYNPKTEDDAVILHKEIKTGTPSLKPSVEVIDNELAYQILSRSQTHWLSIGETIGAWIVRKYPRP